MPEQAEWGGRARYNPDFGVAEPDDDDYGYAWSVKPVANSANGYDTRASGEKLQAQIVSLQAAVTVLTDEVRHLREDVGRLAAGESQL